MTEEEIDNKEIEFFKKYTNFKRKMQHLKFENLEELSQKIDKLEKELRINRMLTSFPHPCPVCNIFTFKQCVICNGKGLVWSKE